MTPEQKLYTALLAAIGSPADERIYPVRVPSGKAVPAVAYQRAGTVYDHTIHSNTFVQQSATFDVFCVDSTYTGAEAVGNQVEGLNVDGIRVVNRTSTVGDEEGDPFAAIVTLEVDV